MKKYLLIDGDSLAYYEMNKETLEEGLANIDHRINDMMVATEASGYYLFMSTKSFRHDIATLRKYKGNRGTLDNILLPSLLKYLEVAHNGLRMDKLEADDLVTYFKTQSPDEFIVCSPDKDVLYQLEGTHYNYGKKEFITVTEEETERFLWKQVLMGDSTDNIEGLPGIGEKKATKLLDSFSNYSKDSLEVYMERFGYLEGIYRFKETFDLVYLLKTKGDMERRIGKLPELTNLIEADFSGIKDYINED